ncbi:MAG: hypothetical protein NTZ46_04480, partial [Verrucomicrobia bacterium]|nr:hypothetical protein [Verrucomicrobiota bacterium]
MRLQSVMCLPGFLKRLPQGRINASKIIRNSGIQEKNQEKESGSQEKFSRLKILCKSAKSMDAFFLNSRFSVPFFQCVVLVTKLQLGNALAS